MKTLLEIKFKGWTATPRMPFILSGNALCMANPSYSMLMGLVGCCLGRYVEPNEVRIGFKYAYDGSAEDVETRHRLKYKAGKIKPHEKGTDAYKREFHVNPRLTLWLDRLDWEEHFHNPIGAPVLGRSQDLLAIKTDTIRKVSVEPIASGKISGCMIPFDGNVQAPGQLLQLAEAFCENDEIGSGRRATCSRVFLSIPCMDETQEGLITPMFLKNLYKTEENISFYLHEWQN